MRFLVISETRSRGRPQLLEPWDEVQEGGDVLKAAIGEGRAIEALARRQPTDLAVEAVVVVIANEALERRLGVGQRAEDLTVEDLALERRPERLDLAVGPGRVDLGLDLADLKLAQGLAEAVEQPGHPVDELAAVVGHQLEWLAAQLDAVAQPLQDRRDLVPGGDAQAEHVAGVVVDQAEDPGPQIALLGELDEERAFDVDVPERVRAGTLIARAALAGQRRSRGPEVVEELLDPAVADIGDLAPAQLGRDPLGVPVRVQAHRDHDLFDPGRVREPRILRAAPLRDQCGQTAARVRALPAPETRSAAARSEPSDDALFARDPQRPRSGADDAEVARQLLPLGRPAAAGCEEPKAGAFLVRVPEPATMRIAELLGAAEDLIHDPDASGGVSRTTRNLT